MRCLKDRNVDTEAPYPLKRQANYDERMREAIIVITLGIVAWAIFLVFALAANADSKVIYTALVGIALGLIGIRYTIRRGRRERL